MKLRQPLNDHPGFKCKRRSQQLAFDKSVYSSRTIAERSTPRSSGITVSALRAKRFAPQTSLETLVFAALFADLLGWALVVGGVEHFAIRPGITTTNPLDLYDYPISHGLATDFAWATLLAIAYYLIRRYRRGSVLIFVAVLSHWILDFLAHRADMPLAPGIHKYYGLGLYNSRFGMIVVEGLIWVIGIVLYVGTTRSKKRVGIYVFWLGAALLTWVWAVSLKGSPPPETIIQAGISSLIFMAITLAWAYAVDQWRFSTVPSGGCSRDERGGGIPKVDRYGAERQIAIARIFPTSREIE